MWNSCGLVSRNLAPKSDPQDGVMESGPKSPTPTTRAPVGHEYRSGHLSRAGLRVDERKLTENLLGSHGSAQLSADVDLSDATQRPFINMDHFDRFERRFASGFPA